MIRVKPFIVGVALFSLQSLNMLSNVDDKSGPEYSTVYVNAVQSSTVYNPNVIVSNIDTVALDQEVQLVKEFHIDRP